MDFSFLPKSIENAISYLNKDKLYELRLRINYPIKINYSNNRLFLGKNGITKFSNEYLIVNQNDINEILNNITEHSIYAFNERIKDGFITTKDGARIGICGDCVFNNGEIVTIKNISSLNIRIPHEIEDCSKLIYKYTCKNINRKTNKYSKT